MAVVKNLMIRIGADYSAAKAGMQGASRELDKFKKDATRATKDIAGKRGLGNISTGFKTLSGSISSSFAEIRGAKGLGGVAVGLKELRPALGVAISGFAGLGAAAGGAAAALGPVGVGLAAIVAILAIGTIGIAAASQEAVKFQSTIGRLNMQLKGGSREFMTWARSMGLAKSDAADMGATYSVLLSSFINNNKDLVASTKQITQTTRVVASATGRTIEDTTERIRSGLLGNTEAIEDLGIFVNVSMIESTKAFKKFANGKHWEQLDFRVQQQIRLAAIMEQAYDRYGDSLQRNVMTSQENLIGQLKDVKLNLSQAFLPIWDAIIPALTRLATGLAGATENIARFAYWLRGWNYDDATKGTDKQTDAVKDLGDATQKAGEKAKDSLAAFDEINQLGDMGGGSGSGGSGSAGGASGNGSSASSSGGGFKMPDIPPLPHLQLQFDPPTPPDAGAGGVATAVTNTVNGLVADTQQKINDMWASVQTASQTGATNQKTIFGSFSSDATSSISAMTSGVSTNWGNLWSNLQSQSASGAAGQNALWNTWSAELTWTTVPAMTSGISLNWLSMWQQMMATSTENISVLQPELSSFFTFTRDDAAITSTQVQESWKQLLVTMLNELITNRPSISLEWEGLKETVLSIGDPLETTKTSWHNALDYMQAQLNSYQPYLAWGWTMIGLSPLGIIPSLDQTQSAWSKTLSDMLSTIISKTDPILTRIEAIKLEWASLMAMIGSPIQIPEIKLPSISSLLEPILSAGQAAVNAVTPAQQQDDASRNLPVIGQLLRGLDAMGGYVEDSGIGSLLRSALVPGASVSGVGSAAGGAAVQGGSLLEKLREALQGLGGAIPAFATGGIVSSPTLAMIGEAGPEAVVPLEDTGFVDAIASAVGSAVMVAIQMSGQGGNSQNGDIVVNVDGATLARVAYPYMQREQQRIGSAAINQL